MGNSTMTELNAATTGVGMSTPALLANSTWVVETPEGVPLWLVTCTCSFVKSELNRQKLSGPVEAGRGSGTRSGGRSCSGLEGL